MASVHTIRETNLALPANSYIYKLLSTAPAQYPIPASKLETLAAISSDDSLHFLDASAFQVTRTIKKVNKSVTCLERMNDQSGWNVATAGRDGIVRIWDRRQDTMVHEIQIPNNLPVSALVCDQGRNFLAVGIENPDDGLGETPVCIWDTRSPQTPKLQFIESHTDTVTDLQLHPEMPTMLLTASTDGLVNIFDTSKPDEEEALYQVINHRSAVHHAGFLFPGTDIYALGTDETLSFYALQSQDEEKEEPAPKHVGDVRERLDCEYLVKMHWVGDEAYLATGKHSEKRLDLIPILKPSGSGPLQYDCDLTRRIQFTGGHGEEIVRDILTDVHTETTFTCGEDGFIRAWEFQSSGDTAMEAIEAAPEKKHSKSKSKKEKRKGDRNEKSSGKKTRYEPY